jgi:hypothetical protein
MDRAALLARLEARPLDWLEAQELTSGNTIASMVLRDVARTLAALRAVLPSESPNHAREAQAIWVYREALVSLASRLVV